MKKLSAMFFIASLVLGVSSVIWQQNLNICLFLLFFYLLPLLLFSFGLSILSFSGNLIAVKGSILFTFIYTIIYYIDVIDFQLLLNTTSSEMISTGNIEMDISSVVTTFITVFVLTKVFKFFNRKLMKV